MGLLNSRGKPYATDCATVQARVKRRAFELATLYGSRWVTLLGVVDTSSRLPEIRRLEAEQRRDKTLLSKPHIKEI
jgi:hypothetical protein